MLIVLFIFAGARSDDDHEAWDQDVDRGEDEKGLVDFEAGAGDFLEECPVITSARQKPKMST